MTYSETFQEEQNKLAIIRLEAKRGSDANRYDQLLMELKYIANKWDDLYDRDQITPDEFISLFTNRDALREYLFGEKAKRTSGILTSLSPTATVPRRERAQPTAPPPAPGTPPTGKRPGARGNRS